MKSFILVVIMARLMLGCSETTPACDVCDAQAKCTHCKNGLYRFVTPHNGDVICTPSCATHSGMLTYDLLNRQCVDQCSGTCASDCTPDGQCIARPPHQCEHTSTFLFDSKCSYFGCPYGYFADFSTFECSQCSTDCETCSSSDHCLSCKPSFYLDLSSHTCQPKISNIVPELTILVSHLSAHQSQLITSCDGSLSAPFFDLRDALSYAQDQMGPYQEASVTIYLTLGSHFIPLQTTRYQHQSTDNPNADLTYSLTIEPLPCSYSSAQANVYGDYCLTGEVESASVSVFNLIGAYFQLTVPRSLVIKGIKFDSLGVQTQWSLDCLGSRESKCAYDLNLGIQSLSGSCPCAIQTYTYQSCFQLTSTPFIKVPQFSSSSLTQPRSLTILFSQFQNFFEGYSSVIGFANGPGLSLQIMNSQFQNISLCYGALSNKELPIYAGLQHHPLSERYDALNPPLANTHSYSCTACSSIEIRGSSFTHFNTFNIPTSQQHSHAISLDGVSFIFFRGFVIDLTSFQGPISIAQSSFSHNILKYTNVNIAAQNSPQADLDYFFGQAVQRSSLFTEMPVVLADVKDEVSIVDNQFSQSTGTKGVVQVNFFNHHSSYAFIAGNSFENNSGFYKSSALHLNSYVDAYSLEDSSLSKCSNFFIYNNTFKYNVLMLQDNSLIAVSCVRLQEDILQASQTSFTWTITSGYDSSVSLPYDFSYNGASLSVNMRYTRIERNTIEQNYKLAGGSLVQLNALPYILFKENSFLRNGDDIASSYYWSAAHFLQTYSPVDINYASSLTSLPFSPLAPQTLILVSYGNLDLEIDGLLCEQNYINSYFDGDNAQILLHQSSEQFQRMQIKNIVVNGTGRHYNRGLVSNIESGDFSNPSSRSSVSYVDGSSIYQYSENSLFHFAMTSPPSSLYFFNISISNVEFYISTFIKSGLLEATGFLQYSYVMNVEFDTVSVYNSKYTKPLYQSGKGRTTIRNFNLTNVDIYMLVYCYRGYYVDFYDLTVKNSAFYKLYRVQWYAYYSKVFNVLIQDSSFSNNFISVNDLTWLWIDNVTIRNVTMELPTEDTDPRQLILMETGALYADYLNFYSNPALDRCQFLSAFDNVYAYQWTLQRIPNTQGSCSVPLMKLKNEPASMQYITVRDFANLGLQSLGGVYLLENTALSDYGGQYYNNSANLGAVYYMKAGASLTSTNAHYQNNEATSGGVFYLVSDSTISVSNAQILNNKATIKGGMLWSTGSSSFSISGSTISGSTASSIAILGVQLSQLVSGSSISNTQILNNVAANDQTMRLVDTELLLDGVIYTDNYGSNLIGGINSLRTALTISDSTFSNSESVYEACVANTAMNVEGGFILSEISSTLTITQSTFLRGCASVGAALMISGSTVTNLVGVTFASNYAHQQGGATYFVDHSGGQIKNSTFSANYATKGADIYLSTPENGADSFTLNQLIFNLIEGTQSFYLSEALATLTLSTFQDSLTSVGTVHSNNVIECESCLALSIESSIFNQLSTSSVVLIEASPSQTLINLFNNSFAQIEAHSSGGAIRIRQASPFSIIYNNFTSINALGFKGGALLLETLASQGTVTHNRFIGCSAEIGGGLAFNHFKPVLSENYFLNNYATVYGNDMASYAVALSQITAQEAGRELADGVVSDIQSGGPFNAVYLALKDELGQIIASDSTSRVTVIIHESASTSYAATLRGTIEYTANRGIFVVEGIEVISEPGTQVTLKLRTDGIDDSLPLVDSLQDFWDSMKLEVELRFCIAGEEFLITGECNECSVGYYLLEAPTAPQNCIICPSNAVCFGGNKMGPQPGFWRQDAMSLNFLKCYNPASCLGSSSEPYAPQGTCHPFYQGILCAECKQNYSRNASFECEACPEPWKNILLIMTILLVAVAVIIVVVRITLASANSEKSQLSVFIKILFSHLQMLSLIASLDLSWPQQIETFFQKSGAVSQASQQIVSLDCLIKHYSFIKRFYVYLIVFFFLPIFLMLLSTFVWRFCLQLKKPWSIKSAKNYATILIILFLVHPTLTSVLFKAFYCQNINDKYRLVEELSEICWSDSHLYFAGSFGVVGLLFWVIGIPLTTWSMLREVKHNLSMQRVRAQYGFLFKGYKHKAYYWETVIMFRKVLVSFISVFLKSYGVVVQALVSELLLVFFILVTLKVQPYDTRILNFIQILSLAILSITVYCGIYFLSSKDPSDSSFIFGRDYSMTSGGRWFFFLAIVISNLLFVLVWLRHLINTFFESLLTKHPRLYTCCCLCCSQQKLKAKMRKHQDRNVFKERIDEIQRLRNYLSKAQEFYSRGEVFAESEAFDRAIQATKIELSQMQFEQVDQEKFVVKKSRGSKKVYPETEEKSFRELDSTDMFGGSINHTIEYVESKLMRRSPLGSPMHRATFGTIKDEDVEIRKVTKRRNRENYEEKDVENADFEIDCLSERTNEPYIDIVSNEPEAVQGDFVPQKPIRLRSNLRLKKKPLQRRKSVFIPVRDDFQIDLRPAELGHPEEYNVEFVQEPKLRKKSSETSIRTKIKRCGSSGQSVSIYSPTRGNPSPSLSSVRSLEEELPQYLLDQEDPGYDLSFQ